MRGRNEEIEKILGELEFRVAVTTAILSTLDLDEILYVILSGITAGDGLGFNRAFLFLDDEAGRSLRLKMAVGPSSAEDAAAIWRDMRDRRIDFSGLIKRYEAFKKSDIGGGLAQKLASFSLPLHRLEALAASRHALILASQSPLTAVLARCLVNRVPFCSNALNLKHETGGVGGEIMDFSHVAIVPLVVGQRLLGAIVADNVYSQSRVDSDKLRSLHAIGNLAALAIDRARLHARTVAMAEIDGLTGVYNRRYYDEKLSQSLARAERADEPVSIAVFDIDHFKRCNDEHGHLLGDEALKTVARLLVRHVRQSDTVARYGGEEFVILFHNTNAEGARQVAEKLRQVIAAEPLGDDEALRVTVSAGVASTDGGGYEAVALFDRADRALYDAKRSGRNRVCVWSVD